MPRDSLGNYTLPVGNPVIPGTVPSSTVHNATMADLGAEIQDSLSRSGKGGMTGPFSFADGSEANPSATFSNDPASGLYRAGSNDIRATVSANDIISFVWFSGAGYIRSFWGRFKSAVADGATAIGFRFDTDATYTTAGSKLVSVQNGGVEKFSIDQDGCHPSVKIKQGSYIATVSASGSMAANLGFTLPSALPASTVPLTMTSAGVIQPTSVTGASVTAVNANISTGTEPGVALYTGINKAWFTTTRDTTITGAIAGCGVGGSPAGASALFNIPSGYRPTGSALKNAAIPILWYDLGTTSLIPAAIMSDNSGNAYFWGPGGASLANGDILYFNNGASWVPE